MTLAEFRQWRLKLIEWVDRDRNLPPAVFVRATKSLLVLRESVPATRADCPTERPCPHIRCRMHLWTVPVAGRPGLSGVRRNQRGHVISQSGDLPPNGDRIRLEPRCWLGTKTAPSCALDVAATGRKSNIEVSEATGRHRTLIAREIKGALRKACGVAEEMGIDQADFVRTLMQMGEER